MSEFDARIAHKILQQQTAGALDALSGRPKKKLKDMVRRGGKQNDAKTHYEAAYDNVVEGRKLRLAGKWLRARDRESKYRVNDRGKVIHPGY